MKKVFLRMIAVAAVLMLIFVPVMAASVPQEVLTGAESVVRIVVEYEDEYFYGSGFAVAQDSAGVYVATNWHVIDGEPEAIYIWTEDDETLNAEIFARSTQRDLCILKFPKALQMSALCLSDNAQKGDAIFAVGFPGAADYLSDTEAHTAEEATITDGIISAVRHVTLVEDSDVVGLLQISAAINSGNSGGPLFNENGEVVGVNTYSIYDSQGIFGAIAIAELVDLMEDHGLTPAVQEQKVAINAYIIYAGVAAVVGVLLVFFVFFTIGHRKKKTRMHHMDADAKRRVAVSATQRYFDEDYGYSAENPFVVSSVQMEGCYLASFRTESGEAFTWERQLRGESYGVDSYKLFVNGVFNREIFFNPHGNNSEQLPNGLLLDRDTFEAAQQGISVEQLLAQRADAELAEQKKKKRARTIRGSIAAVLAVAVLAGAGWCAYTYGYPWAKYTIAVHYLDDGETERAMELFRQLGSYKDSKAHVLKCRYDLACDLMDAGDYEEAVAAFEVLGTYENAVEQIKRAKYLQAMEEYEAGNYVVSQELFEQIEDYDTAAEMVKECELQMALKAIENEEYDEARERLTTILDYEKKNDELAACYYSMMLNSVEREQWKIAYQDMEAVLQFDINETIELFPYLYEVPLKYSEWLLKQKASSLYDEAVDILSATVIRAKKYGEKEFIDRTTEVLKQAKYDAGTFSFQKRDYVTAARFFKDLDYEDSEQWWLESMYQYVIECKSSNRITWLVVRKLGKMGLEERRVYNYAKTLAQRNYKDAVSVFNELNELL